MGKHRPDQNTATCVAEAAATSPTLQRSALGPWLAAGIAVVSAAAVAVAPVRPADVAIPAAAHSVQSVHLTASAKDTLNQLLFDAAKAGVSATALAAPLYARISGMTEAQARAALAVATLGLAGPLISGPASVLGAVQWALDGIELGYVDLADPFSVFNTILRVASTIAFETLEGRYSVGPDLAPLVPGATGQLFAGGLLRTPTDWSSFGLQLPGTFPALQQLVEGIFGAVNPPPNTGRPLEAAINASLLPIAAIALALADRAEPVLVQLGLDPDEADLFSNFIALGLVGPLISVPGAAGTATQNVLDALASGHPGSILGSLVGAPGIVLDGMVNGNYGPNLYPVVKPDDLHLDDDDELTGNIDIRAGGLLNGLTGIVGPPDAQYLLPGVTSAVSVAVEGIMNVLNPPQNAVAALKKAPVGADAPTAESAAVQIAAPTSADDIPNEPPVEPTKRLRLPSATVDPLGLRKASTATESEAGAGATGRKALRQSASEVRAGLRSVVKRITGFGAHKDKDTAAQSKRPAKDTGDPKRGPAE